MQRYSSRAPEYKYRSRNVCAWYVPFINVKHIEVKTKYNKQEEQWGTL